MNLHTLSLGVFLNATDTLPYSHEITLPIKVKISEIKRKNTSKKLKIILQQIQRYINKVGNILWVGDNDWLYDEI